MNKMILEDLGTRVQSFGVLGLEHKTSQAQIEKYPFFSSLLFSSLSLVCLSFISRLSLVYLSFISFH